MIPLQTIFLIGIFIMGLVWLFILAFSGSRRIPPTHETTGLLHALVIIAVSVSAVLFVHALVFWNMTAYSSAPNFSRTIAIILFALCVIIPTGLFSLPLFQWLSLKSSILDADSDADGIAVARSMADDLIRNMEERISVRILGIQDNNISPFVFGLPWGTAFLVLPRNFDDMCSRACSGDAIRKNALIRLILSHELSHIAGRDLLTLPLLWGYCLSTSIATCALWSLVPFVPDSPHREILLPLAVLMLVSAAVGFFMRYRILGARESLADATSTLAVDPLILAQLIWIQADGKPSALESFLFLASMSKPRRRTLHWSFPGELGWLSIKSHTLHSLRSLSASRGELLRGRTHLIPENPLRFFRAIVTASVLSAFAWWVCARLKIGLVLLSNIPATAKGNWLVHSLETDWSMQASLISAIFTTLAPVLSGVVVVVALLLPFRDIFFEGIRVRRAELGKAIGVSGLAVLLSGMALSLIEPVFIRPLFQTRALLPSTISPGLSIAVACVLFLVFVLVKWAPVLSNLRRLARKLIPMLVMVFLPLVFTFVFFDQISVVARVILFLAAAMVVGIPNVLITNPKLDTDSYVSSEWLEYERVLFYKRTRVKSPGEIDRFDMFDMFAAVLRGTITFTIPILLVALIAYPFLIHLDTWFSSNQALLQAKVSELSNIPLETARSMRWQIVREYLAPYLLLDLHRTTGLSASSIALGLSIGLLAVPYFGALIFNLYWNAENPLVMLDRYPILVALHNMFQLPAKDAVRSAYVSAVNSMVSQRRPFLNGPENVPRMRATCEALALLGNNIPAATSEAMCAWITSCATKSGGFGYAPNMRPDPLHTYHATRMLAGLNRLSGQDKAFHCRWVENQMHHYLESQALVLPTDSLRKVSLLLRSFVLLSDGKMNMTLAGQIGDLVSQLWQKSRRTIEDMSNVLHSFEAVGLLGKSPLTDEVRPGHLAAHEARVISSEPKNNLPDIVALVEIETMLFPMDYRTRPCVLQIQDIISKTFHFPVTGLEQARRK